jgi:collagenase-like protein with putative collagen-binding domain
MTAGYDSRGFFSSAHESVRSVVRGLPYRLGNASSVAARTTDGQTIIAYLPTGNVSAITIDMSKITDPGGQALGWWFNPRNGAAMRISLSPTAGIRKFTAPDANDWVLVLDSAAASLSAPGSSDW